MRISVLILAIINLLILNVYGEEWSSKTFKTEDGFEITLTDNWIEMPEDILRKNEKRANKIQNATNIKFAYGFQRTGTEWFDQPFIIVIIDESGKYQESNFKNAKLLKKSINERSDTIKKSLEGLIDNITYGEPYYDPNLKIMYLINKVENRKYGTNINLMAVKFTNRGAIRIHCVSKENESDVYIPFFKKVAESIKLDSSLEYK